MYILLSLALISLIAMYFMVWRKVALVRNGSVVHSEHAHPFAPDIEVIKKLAKKNAKGYAYVALVTALRVHIRSSGLLKRKYGAFKAFLRGKMEQGIKEGQNGSGQEASKFLKIISDYKGKIRHIKHKIKKEEENS